ncbi:MAG TPA: Txe/YoeB family addiction module toxin [Thermomicrobiaceae bacterium]|nr:Txe/YoeB family addiction module toxin [Thermomicrobiaceae bacterium]
MSPSKRRECVVDPQCLEDLLYWVTTNSGTARRALRLIKAVLRDPFEGEGKPEPLKHLDPGVWSRRITQEHRLIYLVEDDRITFLMARYHYKD